MKFQPALFDKSKLRWDKPFTSAIFGDESSQDEHFFVLGALYFWWKTEDYKNQIAKFEAELAQLKRDHGINVIKWQDVPKPSLKLKGYKACIEYLRYWIPCDAVRIGPPRPGRCSVPKSQSMSGR